MIINFSRSKTWRSCRRKAFNWHHRGLEAGRSMNLVDGGAFHAGVAAGRSSKNWQHAAEVATRQFEEDVKKSYIPEEQLFLIEEHKELTLAMLKLFETQYEHEVYQIIQPECEFDVVLPNTMHNCIMLHWIDATDLSEHWGQPPADKILAHKVLSPHDHHQVGTKSTPGALCRCYTPHRLAGKTDAVVAWNNNIWLDEYKTTSIDGQQFWDQWYMDVQPTIYIYGIWKTLKVRPSGFLLNAITKPSEAQVANWNSKRKYGPNKSIKDYLKFSREAFMRTEEDLKRVERLMIETCVRWEEEVNSGSQRMQQLTPFDYNPSGQVCMMYNRKCDYWSACLAQDQEGELEALSPRTPDYIDIKLGDLVK